MSYVSGQVTTYNKDGAASARFAFFDYLDLKAFDISQYSVVMYPGEYKFEFKDLPLAIWERFDKVWMGPNAIYPYRVGCCARIHKEKTRGKTD